MPSAEAPAPAPAAAESGGEARGKLAIAKELAKAAAKKLGEKLKGYLHREKGEPTADITTALEGIADPKKFSVKEWIGAKVQRFIKRPDTKTIDPYAQAELLGELQLNDQNGQGSTAEAPAAELPPASAVPDATPDAPTVQAPTEAPTPQKPTAPDAETKPTLPPTREVIEFTDAEIDRISSSVDRLRSLGVDPDAADGIIAGDPENAAIVQEMLSGEANPDASAADRAKAANDKVKTEAQKLEDKERDGTITAEETKRLGFLKLLAITLAAVVAVPTVAVGAAAFTSVKSNT